MMAAGSFSTTRVFAGVRAAFVRRWMTIVALTFVFGFAPSLVWEIAIRIQTAVSYRVDIPPAAPGPTQPAPPRASVSTPTDFLSHGVGMALAAFALVTLGGRALAATLNALSVAALTGDPRSGGDILLACGRSAGPLALAALLYILALLAGGILVVPALIILAAWSVIYPVLLTEKTTVLGAFRRSAELTRGHRWLILGLRGLMIVGWFLIRTLAGMLIVRLLVSEPTWDATATVALLIAPAVSALTDGFYELFVGALYVELRRVKEGLAPGMAGEVFG